MNPLCDCRKYATQAKICSLDGQEIARVKLKLEGDGISGWFEPDSASLTRRALDANTYPELLADLGAHQHTLLNVRRQLDKEGRPALIKNACGDMVVNQRFYFACKS